MFEYIVSKTIEVNGNYIEIITVYSELGENLGTLPTDRFNILGGEFYLNYKDDNVSGTTRNYCSINKGSSDNKVKGIKADALSIKITPNTVSSSKMVTV